MTPKDLFEWVFSISASVFVAVVVILVLLRFAALIWGEVKQ